MRWSAGITWYSVGLVTRRALQFAGVGGPRGTNKLSEQRLRGVEGTPLVSMVDNLVLQVTRGYSEPDEGFYSGYVHLTGVGDGLSIR